MVQNLELMMDYFNFLNHYSESQFLFFSDILPELVRADTRRNMVRLLKFIRD